MNHSRRLKIDAALASVCALEAMVQSTKATLQAALVDHEDTEADDPRPLRLCGGASPRTLRAAIAAGELVAVRVGRELRARPSDLAAWLEKRRVRPRQRPERELSPAQRAIEGARQKGALRVVGAGG
jgi:excisionase family DNA binding protein